MHEDHFIYFLQHKLIPALTPCKADPFPGFGIIMDQLKAHYTDRAKNLLVANGLQPLYMPKKLACELSILDNDLFFYLKDSLATDIAIHRRVVRNTAEMQVC